MMMFSIILLHMTLEVTLDSDSETVTVILDDHLVVHARKNENYDVVFNKNYDRIEEEQLQLIVNQLCTGLLNLETDAT
ncbi:MAG: hypothetical protein EBU46_00730 [Nitrosomonadaceae bacterium]|nr:hypothetical protein [Nitrosomonadaceae bacterium]